MAATVMVATLGAIGHTQSRVGNKSTGVTRGGSVAGEGLAIAGIWPRGRLPLLRLS
jgi:hypothetical protein